MQKDQEDYEEYEIDDPEILEGEIPTEKPVSKPRKTNGYKSQKALQARLDNLKKGRDIRKNKTLMRKHFSIENDKPRGRKQQEYYDDDDESDYESESDSEPEYKYSRKRNNRRERSESPKRRKPTKAQAKVLKRLEKVENFLFDLTTAKMKTKKRTKRPSNKTVVVYPPNQPSQPKVNEKEKQDLFNMF
jgi:hypothetical protein